MGILLDNNYVLSIVLIDLTAQYIYIRQPISKDGKHQDERY
ncbi:MAG: hypothetical protein ABIO81_03960 [Ginsengibacter sp.]